MADKKQTMLYGLLTSIASKITYDNTTSGLTADNVQDAIDEVSSNLEPIDVTSKIVMQNGFTFVSGTVYKYGKLVVCQFVVHGTMSTTETTVLNGLPKCDSHFIAFPIVYSTNDAKYSTISPDGGMTIRKQGSNATDNISYCFTYLSNE